MTENGLLDQFPTKYGGGRLLGITHEGLAAYHNDDRVFLAERAGETIRTPPEGYGMAHDMDLMGFDWTASEYILEVAKEDGQWRALSQYGRNLIEKEGYSIEDVVDH